MCLQRFSEIILPHLLVTELSPTDQQLLIAVGGAKMRGLPAGQAVDRLKSRKCRQSEEVCRIHLILIKDSKDTFLLL